MLSDRTLIVVGAGASSELGLPLGWQLKEKISTLLANPSETEEVRGGVPTAIQLYAAKHNVSRDDLYLRGRQIAGALPLAGSIDAYIEAHQHDPHIAFLGKLAIAACLLDSERASPLYVDPRKPQPLDFTKLGGVWLAKLFQILADGRQRQDVDALFNDVYFVTFNYDRCIQQYFCHAIASYFELPFERAAQIVTKLQIIHPYGFLGRIDNVGTRNIPFGGPLQIGPHCAPTLLQVAASINTYSEYLEDEEIVNANRKAMCSAQTAAFIGFAFHRQNVKLIATLKPDRVNRVLATVAGISVSDQQVVRRDMTHCLIAGTYPGPMEHTLYDGHCKDFFDEFRLTLSKRS